MSGLNELEQLVRAHPFFHEMPERFIKVLTGCARSVRFGEGEFLFREGEQADTFYLIRTGKVVMELHAPPRGALQVDTRTAGDALGWSWIVDPYRWFCDARAVEEVEALVFNAVCLRGEWGADPGLAYEMYRRFVPLLHRSLEATQLQLLDVYGAD